MLKIDKLQTEYQRRPLAVETAKPRFSWIYKTDICNFKQDSVRIIVSEKADLSFPVWDSGELAVRDQLVEYAGAPLKSRTVYYWKIIARGGGEMCESEREVFETAPSEEEWLGVWMSTPMSSVGSAICFRKAICCDPNKKVIRARAYVCGIGYHEFYVNGKKIGEDVLNPGTTDYSKSVLYCTYSFENELRSGENVIGAIVGEGWFGGRKLLLQAYIDYEDGSYDEYHSANCAGWWATGAAIVSNSIYDGEVYDARRERLLEGWATPAYQPGWHNGWMYTFIVGGPGGRLRAQTVDPIRIMGKFFPVAVDRIDGMCTVYDMGQNFSGWVRIRVRGKEGAKVCIRYAEGVDQNGRANQLNLRSAKCRDLYILRGDLDIEEYAPRFTYHGFRYVEIKIEGQAEVTEAVGEYVRSSVPQIGSFECSDDTLNQLHKNAVITEGSNLHSIMTDCPQRDERLGWLNDISSRIYQSECNYEMSRFFPKFLQDIAETQDINGAIADTAPFYTGGRPADPVSICYLLLGLHSYRRYGDKRILEVHYEGFKRWVALLNSLADDDGILYFSAYGDWCPPGNFRQEDPPFNKDCPGELVSTAYFYWHALCMNEIAEILDKQEDAHYYAGLAVKIKKAYRKKYLRTDGKGFGTGSQSCNAISLNLGLAEGKDRVEAQESLLQALRDNGYHNATGNQAYRHLFEALTDAGYGEDVYRMLVNPTYPGWGYMLAMGATTVWERWETEMQNTMHSFCHPMFASYDAWLYHRVAGIRFSAQSVGEDKLIFEPTLLSALSYCQAELDTARGPAFIRWERKEDGVSFKIIVPSNCEAEVRLPGREPVYVGSGTYLF